jgi:sugar-specific transcriptional regulator TrmB
MSIKLNLYLEKLGLSKGEIKVYLALINLRSATTGPIVKKSNISSSKVYDVLDKLEKRGLVSHIIKEKTKYFQASSLNSILQYIEEKEKEMEEIKIGVKEAIATLKENQESNPEEAKIFKGYRGIKSGFLEVANSISKDEEYLFFSIGYGKDPLLQQFFRDLALTLKRRKIKVKGIANIKEKDLFENYYKKFHYLMKYTTVNLPSDITIAGNNVITFVWNKEQPVIYIIQSKPLAESYKKFFNEMWDNNKV